LVAILPAFFTIYFLGEGATGQLLILSQVILSMQLGFAIIPLIHLTSDKSKMGDFANKGWVKVLAWLIAIIIVSLNVKLVINTIQGWIAESTNPAVYYYTVIPLAIGAGVLLVYITLFPLVKKSKARRKNVPDGLPQDLQLVASKSYQRIAVTVDFSSSDNVAISNAIAQGGKSAEYILIHIVETAGARMMGQEIDDLETESDRKSLDKYKLDLEAQGYTISVRLGFGNPKRSIPEIVNSEICDLLVMGAHGHHALMDLIFGTTLDAVRHKVKIPVLIV
jgi:manganese transport protein